MKESAPMSTDDSEKRYTKISISQKLHEIAKDICERNGIKMYRFEDDAIKAYIVKNYPEYEDKI